MAGDLARAESAPDVVFREHGLQLSPRLPFERWAELGATLAQIRRSTQWWIGDWVNFGERAYGEKYAQALELTGLDYSTLATYAWVAGRIEPSRRRETLSWSAHREVAALPAPECDALLARADTEHLTSRDLRALRSPDTLETVSFRVPRGVAAAWRRRAHGRRLDELALDLMHEWATRDAS